MVHALEDIRRVLKPGGFLLDIRPLESHWPVEVAGGSQIIEAGRLEDDPAYRVDDEASDAALAETEKSGWYIREQQEFFPFNYSWDTPSEMKEFIEKEWEAPGRLTGDVYRAAQSAWATAGADARVRVPRRMQIARWRKV